MGKEGDLWDDSALINAFDDAISQYKIMHSKKNHDTPPEGEKVTGSSEKDDSNNDSGDLVTKRDADEKSNDTSTAAHEVGEARNVSSLKENNYAGSHEPSPPVDASNGIHIQDTQDAQKGYPYSQDGNDYDQLLGQYYELEEKRQKILEQLNQFGGWNYHYPAGGSNSGVQCSNSQEHLVQACQVSHPNIICSCCPYFCQSSVAPCMSCTGCPLGGGTCVGKPSDDSVTMGPANSSTYEDGKIVRTAMGAAEKALSTIRTNFSGDSNINEEKEKEKVKQETGQCTGSETDLSAVLNAWYSAGFYTGKYLAEQSIANRRHS
ncbi:Survival motor neuron [Quillaja saponaria]|uniref:Survival motor neuron n=1 Tax=Quillaja saponaria TaxID=32244 RepID=A0AAD7L853_QUISA|nr:Survival motor neuron [Quillaja saponaria]